MKKNIFCTITFLIGFAMIFSGCGLFKKKTVQVTPTHNKQTKIEKRVVKVAKEKPKRTIKSTLTPEEIYLANYKKLPTKHTVVKGECLWWIAEYKQIYNDPFMWPFIYKANRDKIKNPNLIYPGQVFNIPRDFTLDQLKKNRKSAGAPRPYLPPKQANLPVELRKQLGWGF